MHRGYTDRYQAESPLKNPVSYAETCLQNACYFLPYFFVLQPGQDPAVFFVLLVITVQKWRVKREKKNAKFIDVQALAQQNQELEQPGIWHLFEAAF